MLQPRFLVQALSLPQPTSPPRCPAAHAIFEAAKGRVYCLQQQGYGQARKRKSAAECGEGQGQGQEAAGVSLEPVLEPLPKWELLREVLQEVQQERQRLLEQGQQGQGQVQLDEERQQQPDAGGEQRPDCDGGSAASTGGGGRLAAAAAAPVLVVCQDAFTAGQLREVLKVEGPQRLLRRLYVDYLQRKAEASAGGKKTGRGEGAGHG